MKEEDSIKKLLKKFNLYDGPDKKDISFGRPVELSNMELTLKNKELEQILKNKFMEVNSQIHKVNGMIESIPEMKKELANNAISLMSKAHTHELIALTK
jgi:hypothetical protein